MSDLKMVSWNVNGIRAWHKKGASDYFLADNMNNLDFFCLQEIKATEDQIPEEIRKPEGYFSYFESSKDKKGYSGVAVYAKNKPNNVTAGLGIEELDREGRQINLFYDDFVLINCYFPNGGGPKERLEYKLKYYEEFLKFIKKQEDSGLKVIFCGDVNVAHEEIDIARPKENENSVGFLPIERAWVDKLIENGYGDTFRELHPKTIKYSWWDLKSRARDRNVGWRIDYFFVDNSLIKNVKKAEIFDEIPGSDHCPIGLQIKF